MMLLIYLQVEIEGMKRANIRDAVALIELASEVEHDITSGEEDWTELKVAMRLKALRSQQMHFRTSSFDAISAYGPNGAIIHYRPTNETDTKIGTDSLFLLDSGKSVLRGVKTFFKCYYDMFICKYDSFRFCSELN